MHAKTLTAGKCLHDEDLTVRTQWIGEVNAIIQNLVIHKDHDVLPQSPLIVDDVSPQLGIFRKHLLERLM